MIIKHRPPHFHQDNSFVFITAKIYAGFSYLASSKMKDYFWQLLKEKALKHKIELKARVVLDNHYHLIVKIEKSNLVPKFIKEIHGASAREIKKNLPTLVTTSGQVLTEEVTSWDKRQEKRLRNGIANFSSRDRRLKSAITKERITDPEILIALVNKKRPIWYQYVDHVLRNEKDYYKHLNYIHQNPVKHGLVKKMSQYKWSSIHRFVKEKGKEWIIDCFRKYPIIDFQPEGIAD